MAALGAYVRLAGGRLVGAAGSDPLPSHGFVRWARPVGELLAGILAHVVTLPLMLVVPPRIEREVEEAMRAALERRQISPALCILWFFPAGRFALWCLSILALAVLCTYMPVPSAAIGLTAADGLLFTYLVGWGVAELTELIAVDHLTAYFRDPFNVADLLLIAAMAATCVTRSVCALESPPADLLASPSPPSPALTPAALAPLGEGGAVAPILCGSWLAQATLLPCQAVAAMLAWLRLLQVLFIFPRYGPLLIMAIRMLEDLFQFIVLALFVIISFAAAFFVLFNGAAALSTPDHEQPPLRFAAILTLLMEGTMDGEPDRIMGMESSMTGVTTFAWLMMAFFGMVVVLLLLNMLIARFAKTFDLVHEDLAGTFQVAFARVAIKGAGLQAVPPPFNLIRGLVLVLYAAVARCCARGETAGRFSLLDSLPDEELTSEETGQMILGFLQKATSPAVRLYPHTVEAWVKQHQHDFSRDERWRTSMQKQLGGVQNSIERLDRRFDEMRGLIEQVLDAKHRAASAQAEERDGQWESPALPTPLAASTIATSSRRAHE